MADFVLHDGTELNFDLYKIGREEYRLLASGQLEDEDVLKLLEKITGVAREVFEHLGIIDWRRMFNVLHKKVQDAVVLVVDSKN